MEEKIKEFVESDEFEEDRKELHRNIEEENGNQYESKIVESEEEIVRLSNRG